MTDLPGLLHEKTINSVVVQRFPLAKARAARELPVKGGVTGKIVQMVKGYARIAVEKHSEKGFHAADDS